MAAQGKTTEFSFRLGISEFGIGVFAVHDISQGTYLRLFGDKESENNEARLLNRKDVPLEFQDLCVSFEDKFLCPPDFGVLPIGWFLNHSKNANARVGEMDPDKYYEWYASQDIKAGEEILIDYNELSEPEDKKEDYYKN